MNSEVHDTSIMMRDMERLYDDFYVRLFRYAETFLGDAEEARDVVAGVFQTVWEDWQHRRAITSPKAAFLYATVRNRCVDLLRRRRAGDNYARQMIQGGLLADDDEVRDFESHVRRLHQAIARLDDRQRQVLMCTYFEGLTYRQTAERLDMSENMVHKHMTHVLAALRKMLKALILLYPWAEALRIIYKQIS